MAEKYPFAPEVRLGLERVARYVFRGGRTKAPAWREYLREFGPRLCSRLLYITDLFLTGVDRENGSILHLPYEGGILNQPEGTRSAWVRMSSIYGEVAAEKMKDRTKTISR
jgi:hypothetical protein